jgi:purine-binding chemotaxis protein CheW
MMTTSQPFPSPAQFNAQRLNQTSARRDHFVVFRIDQINYALPLENVTRALRMVAITPVPDAPPDVMGMINVAGRTVPVINLRRLLGHIERAADINDRLLIFETPGQTAALMVDDVLSLLELLPDQLEQPDRILAQSRLIRASIQQPEGAVLMLDVGHLLPV